MPEPTPAPTPAPTPEPTPAPTMDSIRSAAAALRDVVVRTPVLESALLNARLGGRVLFKPECLQVGGSFKLRGAYNKIRSLDDAGRSRGVVAYSSGNHAQGVAVAARRFSVPATIVMPSDAPRMKLDNTRAYGASIVLYDRCAQDRAAIAARLCEETGAVLVRPYDDADVIAGQGTVGLEAVEDCRERGAHVDILLCPCGGGGLIAGAAIAASSLSPETRVFAVEPEGFDDTRRSLRAGRRLANDGRAGSICDALLPERPGELTFAINRRLLAGGLAVSDESAAQAMLALFSYLKLVVEPAGAVGLAAALAGAIDVRGKTVLVILSGGNVDPERFARIAMPRPR